MQSTTGSPLTAKWQNLTGIGPVGIHSTWVYAYWQYNYEELDDGQHVNQRWQVRISLDDFARLELHPYEHVQLQLSGRGAEDVCFQNSRDYPPFTVLTFERSAGK